MRKFGKKNVVSKSITDYNICILGLPGIGKTTLMVQACEKLVGDDGYIILNTGKEDGISCIDGAIYENVKTWKNFEEVLKDIIKNKDTDYNDLKIVVIDTIDQLFDLAEQEVIRQHNLEKMGERNFKPIKTINAAFGGYGAGLDRVCQLVLDRIWALKDAGVAVWMCGHTKNKDIVDPLTDQTYTTISANLSQKYFNSIKTKMHIVGMAVIDRDIVTESTGRKDINNKEITRNKIVSEARKIIFRDDNYGVDSKSRFADIVDEIPLDPDAFITAVQDAIYKAERNDKPIIEAARTVKASNKKEEKSSVEEEEEVVSEMASEPLIKAEEEKTEALAEDDDDLFAEEAPQEEVIDIEELRDNAKEHIKAVTDKVAKDEIRAIVRTYGKIADVDRQGLKKILAIG